MNAKTKNTGNSEPNFYYNYDLKDSSGHIAYQFIYIGNILGSTYGITAQLKNYDSKTKTMEAILKSVNIDGIFKYSIFNVDETPINKGDGIHQIQIKLVPLNSKDRNNMVKFKFDDSFDIKNDWLNITITNKDIVGVDEDSTHGIDINIDDRRSCNTGNGNG